ncbi:MAG TPA: hypothetical protein VJ482_12755 [Acidimicrobiia bacterium]|nr:hypothetical protein [Acidimicrobiia bacterium]
MENEPWLELLGSDPRPWLLESDEPAARWIALTHLLDHPAHHPEVRSAHAAVLEDPGTADLIGRLGDQFLRGLAPIAVSSAGRSGPSGVYRKVCLRFSEMRFPPWCLHCR